MIDLAADKGIGPQMEHSIAFIVNRMINDPRRWGDPIRNLRHAQMVEYHGRHNDLLAIYSVHDRVPIVFLFQLVPLPDHPLFGENFEE